MRQVCSFYILLLIILSCMTSSSCTSIVLRFDFYILQKVRFKKHYAMICCRDGGLCGLSCGLSLFAVHTQTCLTIPTLLMMMMVSSGTEIEVSFC